MSALRFQVHLIAAITAIACALPGVYLVLRRLSLLSDAIGHALLLGIVVAFLLVRDLNSPLLLVGAALAGLLTVSLVEALQNTGKVREDAAIGLVFPALFSLGVILIARYTRTVHLDTDMVLRGEILDAASKHLKIAGYDLGPVALVVMSAILFLNVILLTAFHKELKLATFDAGLAVTLGFAPGFLHYGLMTMVSVTAVGAFEAVGSILVVALMVVPAATALLLSDRLSHVLLWSAAVAVGSSIVGTEVGFRLNVSVAGAMATATGAFFLAALLFAPRCGLIAQARNRVRQRADFYRTMLVIHLANHEGKPEADEECRVDRLPYHLPGG